MASSINASTSGAGGVITTADNTGILNLQTAGTNAVTVNASQNVGIGTSSPAYRLQTFQTGGASISALFQTDQTDSYISFRNTTNASNSSTRIGAAGNDISFLTASSERMRIDSSGNLLVGTTSTLGKATITGANTSDLLALNTTATSGTATAIVYKDGSLDVCGYVSMSATANTVTYVNSSDARLKTNPKDFLGIDIIEKMKPKKYERTCNLGVEEIGFYAQELNEVFPEAVAIGDEDVTIKPWGIDYGRITPVLVKAIQEQQAIINELKARVTALEAK